MAQSSALSAPTQIISLDEIAAVCPDSPPPVVRRISLFLSRVVARHEDSDRSIREPRKQQFLAAILGHARSEGQQGFCWPGTRRLSGLLGTTSSVVRAARQPWSKLGVLGREVREGRCGYVVPEWDDVWDDTPPEESPPPPTPPASARRTQNSKTTTTPTLPPRKRIFWQSSFNAPAASGVNAKKARWREEGYAAIREEVADESTPPNLRTLAKCAMWLKIDPPMIRKLLGVCQASADWIKAIYQRALGRPPKHQQGFFVAANFKPKSYAAYSDVETYQRHREASAARKASPPKESPLSERFARFEGLSRSDKVRVARWVADNYSEGTYERMAIKRGRMNDPAVQKVFVVAMGVLGL